MSTRKKVIVVRFFWVTGNELNKITFDTQSAYTDWLDFQGSSVEVLSEKEEYEIV